MDRILEKVDRISEYGEYFRKAAYILKLASADSILKKARS
jgi:hypothetical protein